MDTHPHDPPPNPWSPSPFDRLKFAVLRHLIGLPPVMIAALLCLGLRPRFREALRAYTLQLQAEPSSIAGLLPYVNTLLLCFFEGTLRLILVLLLYFCYMWW